MTEIGSRWFSERQRTLLCLRRTGERPRFWPIFRWKN